MILNMPPRYPFIPILFLNNSKFSNLLNHPKIKLYSQSPHLFFLLHLLRGGWIKHIYCY